MIDPQNPTIQTLAQQGYKVAAHAYLRPGGRVNYSFVAKHQTTGRLIQGWSRGKDAAAALADLARHVGSDQDRLTN